MVWTSHLRPVSSAIVGGALAEDGGGQDVAGLVDEGAGEVLRLGDDDAFAKAGFGRRIRATPGGTSDGERLDAAVFAVGAVGVRVEVGEDGAFGDGARGLRQSRSFVRGRSDGQ